MNRSKPQTIGRFVAAMAACWPLVVMSPALADEGPVISASIQADVEQLGDRRQAYAAARRLAERGESIVPELIAALEHTLHDLARYDPNNLGDGKDNYGALLFRQSQLMGLIAAAGDAEHVGQLVALARLIKPESLVVANYFEMLERLGAYKEADEVAAKIIADPASRNLLLYVAMARFEGRPPVAVVDSAKQHLGTEFALTRAMAYQLMIDAGREDEVRAKLIEDVDSLEYTGTGNFRMLHALASIEETETFLPRIERLRLRPAIKKAAVTANRFAWSDDSAREAMLEEMFDTQYDQVALIGIEFILENGRVDLLEKHNLAWTNTRPIEYYRLLIPGFNEMPRERLLRHMSAEMVDAIESQRSLPVVPQADSRVRRALLRYGYGLEKRNGAIVIIPPDEPS